MSLSKSLLLAKTKDLEGMKQKKNVITRQKTKKWPRKCSGDQTIPRVPALHVLLDKFDKSLDFCCFDVFLQQLPVVVKEGRDGVLG